MEYTVITLSIMGLRGRIFRVGDTVQASNFYEGAIDALLKDGAIKPVEAVSPVLVADDKAAEEVESGVDEPGEIGPSLLTQMTVAAEESDELPAGLPQIDDLSISKIKKMLKSKGVEFDHNASKEDLYALLVD